MAAGRVVQLTAEHLPSLVTRLKSYGAYSVQTRSILRMLQVRVNPAPFQVFTAGSDGSDLVTVTAIKPTPGFTVLDICGREDSAGRRQLDALLHSSELAHLWRQGPLRVEAVAEGLAPVVSAAAADNGLRRVLSDGESQRLFVRPETLPLPPRQQRAGLTVRPLQPRHLARVERVWGYSTTSALYPDTETILRHSQAAGLSAGVFLTESQTDEPASWSLLNIYGAGSFGYTEPAHRNCGLQGMTMAELIHFSARHGLPFFGYTTDSNAGQLRNLRLFECSPEHITQWLCFVPSSDR